jgi:hypothetical protein
VVWSQNHWDGLLVVLWPNHWDGFSRFGFKTIGAGFSSLNLKTDSYSLVIWISKSLRCFLGLDLKIKRATVCQVRHKIDGRMKTV